MTFACILDYSGVFDHRLFLDFACVIFSGFALPFALDYAMATDASAMDLDS